MSDSCQDPSPVEIEAANKLFSLDCQFVKGVVSSDELPPPDRPEVAFAGRSNVGKSSLLNAVTGRRSIARTSNTPGRTREINYFDVASLVYLVDLPGYGYARASKSLVRKWTSLVYDYLRGRSNLRRAFLLIDSRRGIMDADKAVMEMLDVAAVSYQVVMTKADKLRADAVVDAERSIYNQLKPHIAAHPEILVTSSEKHVGIESVRVEIASFVEAKDP